MALGPEMGIRSSIIKGGVLVGEKEMEEVACQTDFSDVIFTAPSALETSDASIQVGLEVAATQSDVEVLWL